MKHNRILIINAGLNGRDGQSHFLSQKAASLLSAREIVIKELVLATEKDINTWKDLVSWADGFIFITGTYWDSWSSCLQDFLEQTSTWEGSPLWLGKPASVIVSMHSVGAKGIASRLQGVLSTLGLLLPPMTSFVYSLTTHLALKGEASAQQVEDFWTLDDLKVILTNLTHALEIPRTSWQSWCVDSKNFKQKWIDK